MVIAWLERDVGGRAARIFTALAHIAQRFDLGMRLAAVMMPALPERDAVAHDDAADWWVRHRVGDGARCELDRARDVRAIAVYGLTSTPFQNAT